MYKRQNIIFILFCLLLVFTLFSCSEEKRAKNFSNQLIEADNQLKNNTRDSALKFLAKLRRRAKLPNEFLSVAKREVKLKQDDNAIKTLKKGLQKEPSNELVAYLVYLLNKTGQLDEAGKYNSMLINTIYSSIGLESDLNSDKVNNVNSFDYEFYMRAFHATQDQHFLVNAALLLARDGRLIDALKLRGHIKNVSTTNPYFWALLAFDLGEFSVVFDELNYSLVYSDLFSHDDEKLSAMARKHVLLAADACFGLGDFEMANANWQLYVDRFPEHTPMVLYNLALTSPNAKQRSIKLYECIKRFPNFYPAMALYTRDYLDFQKINNADTVTNYLVEKDFYSMQMEEEYFSNPEFQDTPDMLLKKCIRLPDADPRFALELFRYNYKLDNSMGQKTAEIWRLLEKYPDSWEVKNYAKWYFSKIGDFDTCFSIGEIGSQTQDCFYKGLNASIKGDVEIALESYEKSSDDPTMTCASFVNEACTQYLLGNLTFAIEKYSNAIELTDSNSEKSKIHFRIAEILIDQGDYIQAKKVLNYSLELDKENYDARNLLNDLNNIN